MPSVSYQLPLPPTDKRCAKCNQILPVSAFSRSKAHPDGLQYWCKDCFRAYQRRYVKETDYWQSYREKRGEKLSDYGKRYRREHRIKMRTLGLRKRARQAGVEGDMTEDDWLAVHELYGYACLKCGATANLTIDHVVPLSKGGRGDISNLQLLCLHCNSSKRQKAIDYRPKQGDAL